MTIERRDITFPSGDSYAAAWLFLPDRGSSGAPAPAVAMAHGLGAVKEMYLEFFARRFAEAGIAALLFDYRYFGASGGEPRQRVSPHDQIEDYRSALTCLSLRPEVDADRLGVWGTSFSGGHVLHVAAYDPRVKVVVSQVGAMDVNEIMHATATPEIRATLEQMTVQERIRRATEGGEIYIPNTLSPGQSFAFQPDPESYEFAHKAQATVAPSWRDEVTMSSLEAVLEYAPARSIDLIAPRPLLMFLAKSDPIAPPETIRAAFARAGEPKRLVEVEGTHYSVYLEAADETCRGAVEWFTEYLNP
ncbi:MAG TPA: alpha/beta hydrolase [Actinomycetota bacterium]|nr:alpha/beta hydrolase [Actinomycetota bacterium]